MIPKRILSDAERWFFQKNYRKPIKMEPSANAICKRRQIQRFTVRIRSGRPRIRVMRVNPVNCLLRSCECRPAGPATAEAASRVPTAPMLCQKPVNLPRAMANRVSPSGLLTASRLPRTSPRANALLSSPR